MVWIDWNQDCDFDDDNEEYDLGTANNAPDIATTLSPLSVTIPSDALLGFNNDESIYEIQFRSNFLYDRSRCRGRGLHYRGNR